MSIVLENPKRPGGEPVIIVSVQDNGSIIADTRIAQKLF